MLFRDTSSSGFKWLSTPLLLSYYVILVVYSLLLVLSFLLCEVDGCIHFTPFLLFSHPSMEAPTETCIQRFLSGLQCLPFGTGEILIPVAFICQCGTFRDLQKRQPNTQRGTQMETHIYICVYINSIYISKQVFRHIHIAFSVSV